MKWKLDGFPFATDSAISLVTAGSTGYVVKYPQDRTGEWTMLYWFDNNWAFKQQLAG